MSIPLEQLLAWASKGLFLFPLAVNSKVPPKGSSGLTGATTDPETITAWANAAPDANWGVSCGKSGLLVLDIDSYKEGADAALAALGDLPPTFEVKTPGGGRHLYFRGDGPNSVEKLGAGLDTRGVGGYVVLPGSTIGGKPYEITKRGKVATFPAAVRAKLGEAKERTAETATPLVELDDPSALAAAAAFLATAEPAVEGNGGDAQTLHTAMRLRDLGVSEDAAVTLLASVYNPRCSPPWEVEELERKVSNAYRYAKGQPGAASPLAAGFEPVPVAPKVRNIKAWTADTFDQETLPARPWVLGHDLIAGFVSGTVAPGGLGKSTLCLLEALAVATGKELTGVKVHRPGAVWVYNTEDPIDELQRRVLASAAHHKIDRSELSRVHVSSGRASPLILAASTRGVVAVNEAIIAEVIEYIQEHQIAVWTVDPFVHTHYCDENANSEIAVVMHAFGRIAEATGCAVSLVHHTTKGQGGAGEMDRARGASSFGGAVRVMRTVTGIGSDEAEKYGLNDEQRKWYFWVDDAKNNMSAPADQRRVFRRVDVTLWSGDHVGTVEPVTLRKVTSEDCKAVLDLVEQGVRKGLWTQWASLTDVVSDLRTIDEFGVLKGQRADSTAAKIKEALVGAVPHVSGSDKLIRVELRGNAWQLIAEPHFDFLE